MKRAILSVFIIVVLVWSCGEAFGRGGARGGGQRGVATRQRMVSNGQGGGQDGTQERMRERERANDGAPGEGRSPQQQMREFEKRMVREEAKHRWRVARLKQIRRLAVGAGKTEITKRVDELLIMERNRYERKLGRISQDMERALKAGEESGD